MITLAHAKSITEDKVKDLREDFRSRVRSWLAECEKEGLLIYVYEGFRTGAQQDELFKRGRTQAGRIVTNAKAGQSFHNYGRAVDCVPLIPSDKVAGMYEAGWDATQLYEEAMRIGLRHALRTLSWETPHFEDMNFGNWKDLASREKPV